MSAAPDNRFSPRSARAGGALGLLLAIAALPAAAELIVEPYVAAGARFDSNPRYLASNVSFEPDSAWGTIVDARLPMEYRAKRTSVSFDPRLVYSFYPDSDEDDLEDRDHYLEGDASWISQRSNIGADYGYTDLSLRTSEFQEAGGTPGGSGEGLIFLKDKQERWYFQPYWQYLLSRANTVLLNAGYEEVSYDEDFTTRRYDYDYSFVSAMLNHAFNARHSLGLRAQFSQFDSANRDLNVQNDSKTNRLSMVYEYSLSSTTTLSADLGWARTENAVFRPNSFAPGVGPVCNPALVFLFPCEIASDSTNFVGHLKATKQSENTEYELTIGQSITPNSNGAEVLRFNIDAWMNKRISDRIYTRLGVIAFTQDDVGTTDRNFERDYIRGIAYIRYRFSRRWSLYGRYTVTFNDQNDTFFGDRTVRNHFVSAGVVFEGDGWRW